MFRIEGEEEMVWQRLRLGLLTGAILATAGITVRAGDCCAPAPCATQKVCVKEWVPETARHTLLSEFVYEAHGFVQPLRARNRSHNLIAFWRLKYSLSGLDTHPKLWQNKPSHVPLEGQHVDTHPVGQRRVCGAAVGGATGRRSAGYCVPSRDSSRCTPRSSQRSSSAHGCSALTTKSRYDGTRLAVAGLEQDCRSVTTQRSHHSALLDSLLTRAPFQAPIESGTARFHPSENRGEVNETLFRSYFVYFHGRALAGGGGSDRLQHL